MLKRFSLLFVALIACLLCSLARSQSTAIIDVRSHGAIPDDGKDDAFAIQSAIDAARNGQTIVFPPGVFDISRTIDPRGGKRTLKGTTTLVWKDDQVVAENQTILKAGKGEFYMFRFTGEDLSFRNLTFNGRALNCERDNNVMVRNLTIDNCWFHLDVTGERQNAIEFTTGMADTRITNCIFDPIKGDNGIYGYNWENLTIANNRFLNGNEGIHLTAHLDTSKNLLIEQNYLSGIHRMGIEIQGGGNNTIVQDNYYENPVLSKNPKDNEDSFAYSIVSDRSIGTRVRRNTSIAPQRPDGIGVRIVFEIGGQNVICEDNFSVDGNHVIAANGTDATGAAIRNKIVGYLEGPRNSNRARLAFGNNGPGVELTWNIDRGRPGPNKRLPTSQPTTRP